MANKTRGEGASLTDTISLTARFRSQGVLTDLDAFPQVTIIQPSGNVVTGPTGSGVYRLSTGVYGFDYAIGFSPANLGMWTDFWQGSIGGSVVTAEYNFLVSETQVPGPVNADGYVKLGDDPGYDYSQNAIHNINKLLKALKARLNSSGKSRATDANGNVVYIDCDIFSIDQLVTMLATALSMFNEIPTFTLFTFDDSYAINQFFNVIVQGATLIALSSKSLIERGREFTITDNGINFTPPSVSELMNSQWSTEFTNYYEKVKFIKGSIRPAALGLGLISVNTARNPVISQLRHRRARQIV